MTRADIEKFSKAWHGRQVAVIGDVMLDRYIWGSATRISQEAPIPVVEVRETTTRPGGAGNVMYNLATLGAKPLAFGAVGEDPAGVALVAMLKELGVETTGLVSDPAIVTTEKQRIVAGAQQVVRVDTELRRPLDSGLADRMLDRLRREVAAGAVHGIILEDYGKGVLTPEVMGEAAAIGRAANIPVALDPHPSNPVRVHGLTLMTPNHNEAFAMAGIYRSPQVYPVENDVNLQNVVLTLQQEWQFEHLLITLGAGGMVLFGNGRSPLHVPTTAREVFDVSGAGDTVIAAFMLALLAGAPAEDAAVISNHAAGIVVGKVGTVPVELGELLASFAK